MADKDDTFVDRWTDELLGQLLDAVTKTRTGAELSMWLKSSSAKIRDGVMRMRQEIRPQPPVDVVEAFLVMYPKLDAKNREAIAGRLKESMKAVKQ